MKREDAENTSGFHSSTKVYLHSRWEFLEKKEW